MSFSPGTPALDEVEWQTGIAEGQGFGLLGALGVSGLVRQGVRRRTEGRPAWPSCETVRRSRPATTSRRRSTST